MALSMTGYGRSSSVSGDVEVTVEVKTLNHRYLEISPRISIPHTSLDPLIRERVRKYMERGKADITVSVKDKRSKARKFSINEPVLRGYLEVEEELRSTFGLPGSLGMEKALTLNGVLDVEEIEHEEDPVADLVSASLEEALREVCRMRKVEGEAIGKFLGKKKRSLTIIIRKIEGLSEENKHIMGIKLRERVSEFLEKAGSSLENSGERLAAEIAILADRLDISEEVKRVHTHIDQFGKTLRARKGAVGRKLDFIIQELNREFNTIGAKSQSSDIQVLVIEGKALIEKMREQVQNLE